MLVGIFDKVRLVGQHFKDMIGSDIVKPYRGHNKIKLKYFLLCISFSNLNFNDYYHYKFNFRFTEIKKMEEIKLQIKDNVSNVVIVNIANV